MAGIMIEDQVAPKRCGHTNGKLVLGREEAYNRIRAACDARYSAAVHPGGSVSVPPKDVRRAP